jgi:hypothetical protein
MNGGAYTKSCWRLLPALALGFVLNIFFTLHRVFFTLCLFACRYYTILLPPLSLYSNSYQRLFSLSSTYVVLLCCGDRVHDAVFPFAVVTEFMMLFSPLLW